MQLLCGVFARCCFYALLSLLPFLPFLPLVPVECKKENGDLAAAIFFMDLLVQLLNKYFLSLDYTVAVNCYNNVYTAYRSRNCSTCWCVVAYCNNLSALNYEVID